MRAGVRAAILAAGLLLLGQTVASAQTFDQLTQEGQAAFRRGDYQKAIATRLQQLPMTVQKPADHCFVYWGLYTAYVNGTGEMAKGLKAADDSLACLNAIANDSQDSREFRAEAQRYRAIALRDWGRTDEAMAAVDEMEKLLPGSDGLLTNRAITLSAKGDYAGAYAFYRRAGERPKGGYWMQQAIWTRVKQGNPEAAAGELASFELKNPRVAGSDTNMRAWIMVEQRRYDAAIAALKYDEGTVSPLHDVFVYLRGYVEAARGNFAEATKAFRDAASSQNSNATVRTALYLAQARSGGPGLDSAQQAGASVDATRWPESQLAFISGRIDRAAFETTAKFGNPRIEATRICRAALVEGEVALIKGDTATAKQDLQRVVSTCAVEPAAQERTWAIGELARLNAPVPQAAPAPVTPQATATPAAPVGDCAAATVHWSSAESLGTRAAYEDHLARFPNCAFATLAAARIAALDRSGAAPEPARAAKPACAPPMVADNDGDCVRPKAKAAAAPPRQRHTATRRSAPAASGEEGGNKQVLDCSTPAGLFACANREMGRLQRGQGTSE